MKERYRRILNRHTHTHIQGKKRALSGLFPNHGKNSSSILVRNDNIIGKSLIFDEIIEQLMITELPNYRNSPSLYIYITSHSNKYCPLTKVRIKCHFHLKWIKLICKVNSEFNGKLKFDNKLSTMNYEL